MDLNSYTLSAIVFVLISFSPSLGGNAEYYSEKGYSDYVQAELHGHSPSADCTRKYNYCSVSILPMLLNLLQDIFIAKSS